MPGSSRFRAHFFIFFGKGIDIFKLLTITQYCKNDERRRLHINAQYQKGVLDLCVLSLLHKRDCYGYEISDFLSRHIDIADGTVYPILRKLKADGLLTT